MTDLTARDRALFHAVACRIDEREVSDACARTIARLFAPAAPGGPLRAFLESGLIVSADAVWGALFGLDAPRCYGLLSRGDAILADMLGTYLIAATREQDGTRDRVLGWPGLGPEAIYLAAEHSPFA